MCILGSGSAAGTSSLAPSTTCSACRLPVLGLVLIQMGGVGEYSLQFSKPVVRSVVFREYFVVECCFLCLAATGFQWIGF